MKKSLLLCAVFCAAGLGMAGCASTQTVVKEFDSNGKVTRETVTKESVVKEVTASTQNKTVIVWENGWMAYLSVSTATTDDPTPTAKMFAGKAAKGVISAQPDQQNWDGIAKAISATKENLNVSTTGISGTSATTADTGTSAATAK